MEATNRSRHAHRVIMMATLVALAASQIRAQQGNTNELVARTTTYVHQFIETFSSVVAEEQYEQKTSRPNRKRLLTSDYLLVKYPGADQWITFRDVLTVDGESVRDQDRDRLTRLFLDAPSSAMDRAREISKESTRYNLTDIGSLGNPLLALSFLQAQYQPRFRFSVGGMDKGVGPNARVILFDERTRPSLLRTASNAELPSHGRIWVEEGTGAVMKTELNVGITQFPIQVITTFTKDNDFGVYVPAEMREWYPRVSGPVTCTAKYTRFRRFQVQTGQTIR